MTSTTTDLALAGRGSRSRRARRTRVYLHIGEPKTGTTFIQGAMWANRGQLAAGGVVLPGFDRFDHSRASRDLRGAPRLPSDRADPWTGEWDVLVRQAMRAPEVALISDEVLSACNPPQADRAVRSLLSAEPHIVVTLRDIASALPAEWQESVKCRGTQPWDAWLQAVIEAAPTPDRRRTSWFWTVHDTLANLAMWSKHLPPERVHVITVPQQGTPSMLWARFASVLGVDPEGMDFDRVRSNTSLGLMEVEVLRRMNEALPPDLPYWFYTRNIKRLLAHHVLSSRPEPARLTLRPEVVEWARGQSEILISGLRESGYHIVGDLSDLLPRPAEPSTVVLAAAATERMVEAAVLATAALAEQHFREMYSAKGPQQELSGMRQALGHFRWIMLNGPRVQRMLRKASHLRVARQLRVIIWRVLVRPGRQRPAKLEPSAAAQPVQPQSSSSS